MKVHVEWLDGETRTYANVGQALTAGDARVLTLLGHRAYGGPAEHIASIPLDAVRAYRKEE